MSEQLLNEKCSFCINEHPDMLLYVGQGKETYFCYICVKNPELPFAESRKSLKNIEDLLLTHQVPNFLKSK